MTSHVRYIDKTRDYYLEAGYSTPYRWAHFDEVPFTPLNKPLSECCVTIVSTSDVEEKSEKNESDDGEPNLFGNVYEIASSVKASELFTPRGHYDSHATNVDDVDTFFPVTRLHESVAEGRVGSIAPVFYGVCTPYSQRRTREVDAPDVLERCRENNVDAVILTPL